MHCGYIVKVNKLRDHPNADKLQIATFFGEDVCVSLETKLDDIGIYFPCDLQLSEVFCITNHLLRKLPDGTPDTGYMDETKRNVKAIKLRGEKSNGIYLPLSSLDAFGDTSELKPGDMINVFNGHEICRKYIPKGNPCKSAGGGNKTRKTKRPIAPLFAEHADTKQLAYNHDAFKIGDDLDITLKIHGTSQRTGYLPKLVGYKKTFLDKIFKREGTPTYDWGYVTGTRRTVIDDFENRETSFYGSDKFREQHAKAFEGKLQKGETVYYEVAGFTDNGTPIMAICDNRKTNDKAFIKQYGEKTIFSYGCAPGHLDGKILEKEVIDNKGITYPQSRLFVYRMTMTNEDGFVVEYTPEFMRYRCEQMGVECCPLLAKVRIRGEGPIVDDCYNKEYGIPYEFNGSIGETVQHIAEQYYDGPDPIGRTHIREGVVVRIMNRPKFTAYKHKNFNFKMVSGIVSETINTDNLSEDILSEL